MLVVTRAVERVSRGTLPCWGTVEADDRRTTLTRHMNHHVGTQPPAAPSVGYSVTRFGTSTSTTTTVSATTSAPPLPSSLPPPFGAQMPPGGQNPGTGVQTLVPQSAYTDGPTGTSANPYGSQHVGYTTRSMRSGLGTSPPQRTSEPQRYHERRSSLPPPPQFTPISHSRSYSAVTTTFPPRPQGEQQSTIRIREYQPPSPYDLRHPSERRQTMPSSQQQTAHQPLPRATPSFPPSSPMQPPPPPSPSRRHGHRRIASEMEAPGETEERIPKRRRSDRGP